MQCKAVFDFFKKAVRAQSNSEAPPALPAGAGSLPLGLRVGGSVTIDALPLRMLSGASLLELAQPQQVIEARGWIDLGQGAHLHRFYLSDELFLQVGVVATGGSGSSIEGIKLFQFFETKIPATREALEAWLKAPSEIGQEHISFSRKSFRRVWGDAVSWAPPVVFDEVVYKNSPQPDYDLTHYAMLFERDLPNDRMEYLLISVEDSGPEDYCVVYSIGLDLSVADLEIF